MNDIINLTKECFYDSFILDNLICKPLSEDLFFRGLLIFLGLFLIWITYEGLI